MGGGGGGALKYLDNGIPGSVASPGTVAHRTPAHIRHWQNDEYYFPNVRNALDTYIVMTKMLPGLPGLLVWIGMLELTCGRLDGSWITATERKHFHICFPSYASIAIGMGVIFVITNRVNKQIILQTEV